MKSYPLSSLALCLGSFAGAALAQCPAGGYPPPAPPPPPALAGPQYNGPTGPSTPGPGGPSVPGPGSPSTPGARGPAGNPAGPATPFGGAPAGGRAMPATPRGVALVLERGATSKDRLRIDWLHPVPEARVGTGTAAAGPLSFEAALAVLWEDGDDRPLLVLRECTACAGGDDALLSRSTQSERVMLMTKWFRTVRLPPHVMLPQHPFHNLFAGRDTKDGTPHFFLLADPESEPVVFHGRQTQNDLQKGILSVLAKRYAHDAQKALKQWLQVLDTFDTLDAREQQLQDQLAEVRANAGPESDQAKKFTAKLAEVAAERAAALAREAKVRDLGLLSMTRTALGAAK